MKGKAGLRAAGQGDGQDSGRLGGLALRMTECPPSQVDGSTEEYVRGGSNRWWGGRLQAQKLRDITGMQTDAHMWEKWGLSNSSLAVVQ